MRVRGRHGSGSIGRRLKPRGDEEPRRIRRQPVKLPPGYQEFQQLLRQPMKPPGGREVLRIRPEVLFRGRDPASPPWFRPGFPFLRTREYPYGRRAAYPPRPDPRIIPLLRRCRAPQGEKENPAPPCRKSRGADSPGRNANQAQRWDFSPLRHRKPLCLDSRLCSGSPPRFRSARGRRRLLPLHHPGGLHTANYAGRLLRLP